MWFPPLRKNAECLPPKPIGHTFGKNFGYLYIMESHMSNPAGNFSGK
jgi:hypothetical protein